MEGGDQLWCKASGKLISIIDNRQSTIDNRQSTSWVHPLPFNFPELHNNNNVQELATIIGLLHNRTQGSCDMDGIVVFVVIKTAFGIRAKAPIFMITESWSWCISSQRHLTLVPPPRPQVIAEYFRMLCMVNINGLWVSCFLCAKMSQLDPFTIISA